jgi:HSP20 family molecular chaperone IbpA
MSVLLMNKLFLDSMFPHSRSTLDENLLGKGAEMPAFTKERLYKSEKGYKLLIPLAGVAKEDITLKVLNNTVEITATRKFEDMPVASYTRFYDVGDDVDINAISSKYTNGLLCVELPYKKAKEVAVNIAVN